MKVRRWVAIAGPMPDGAFYAANVHTLSAVRRVVALGERCSSPSVRGGAEHASRSVAGRAEHTAGTARDRVRMAVTVYRVLPELGQDVAFDPDNVVAARRGLRFPGSGLSGRPLEQDRPFRAPGGTCRRGTRRRGTRRNQAGRHLRQALDQPPYPRRTDEL
ncbi:hypothetical protein GCM10028799_63180 [Kribbella italica]